MEQRSAHARVVARFYAVDAAAHPGIAAFVELLQLVEFPGRAGVRRSRRWRSGPRLPPAIRLGVYDE